MPKYLLVKHYRGGRPSLNDAEMTAEEFDDHVAYMWALADRLRRSGELIEERALTDEADWVRWDGDDRPAVVDGPIEESKALVAGFMGIDVVDRERALEIAAELSAAPGAGGRPLGEWLELRRFLE